MAWNATHISQTINRDVATVTAFAANPANLPVWAAGLSAGIRHEDGRWITDSPMGVVEVAFIGPVEHGILDHDVTFPDGTVVRNILRVLPNGDGSEILFSLYQTQGMTDEAFENGAKMVRADLARLHDALEP
jgi:hypothetical protein